MGGNDWFFKLNTTQRVILRKAAKLLQDGWLVKLDPKKWDENRETEIEKAPDYATSTGGLSIS